MAKRLRYLTGKAWYRHMWVFIIVVFFILYLLIQGIRCSLSVIRGRKRVASYEAKTAALSYGKMTYVDRGQGEVILSVHGIFGGYDQAFDTCRTFRSDYRILAPSRFGYLGSDVLGEGTPAGQAAAYVELLDNLGIQKVFVLATSAGGSPAIRFALDYPQRTKGLILYCSAMPCDEKPEKYMKYAGPPKFLCNDYAMFLLSPLFELMMGMKPSTIHSMVPISDRKSGVVLDASVTNPDMARNYDSYQIESLQVPVLIFHAEDDKLARYEDVEKVMHRFPECKFVPFTTGGHLMTGHTEEVEKEVKKFTKTVSGGY